METEKTDTGPASMLWDVPAALVLLTRLPVPALPSKAFADPARAVWAYPLVGLILALITGALISLSAALGLPAPIIAGLVLGVLILLTGAMHEDGLADSADGLWGGHDRARRLEIMKDSRIGAYGVLALIVVMGLRWMGLAEATWPAIVAALVLSRMMMPALMLALPHARSDGLSHSVGAPPRSSVLAGVFIGTVIAVACVGMAGVIALCIASLSTVAIGVIARRKIGGQTGDILGATQILTELSVLLSLVAMA
ncbi:adenosylcobinamide-GDP ribazoletransferase [Tateyamaria sp.]|uniref:adenosylcobinamide-GDP ribazoletransferase n=1 Tax=Tateyamaria sp. TaxID=1929288 RepID=UPI003B2228C3